MRQIHRVLLCVAPLLFTLVARADVVTDWNRIALPIITAYSLSAPSYRDFAMLHVAMFQCINTIEPRYEAYGTKLEPQPGASKDAAAAVAAARILVRLHPDAAPKVDAELKQYLEKLADRAAGAAGIEAGSALGEKVAALVWEMRANDGANAPNQNFQDFPTNKANFGADGRIEYLAFGKWSQYEDFTALGNKQDLLAFGAGVDFTEAEGSPECCRVHGLADVRYLPGAAAIVQRGPRRDRQDEAEKARQRPALHDAAPGPGAHQEVSRQQHGQRRHPQRPAAHAEA